MYLSSCKSTKSLLKYLFYGMVFFEIKYKCSRIAKTT